jgi:chromosome segregation ATPase
MKRLDCFNLIGVLALAVLCCAQWRHDRQVHMEVNQREKAIMELSRKLSEAEQNAKAAADDLTEFKTQFAKSRNDLADSLQKLRLAERQTNQLTLERDQLKAGITNWAAALSIRDERLKEANLEITRLSQELNASVLKFNELVKNYNRAVAQLSGERSDTNSVSPRQP